MSDKDYGSIVSRRTGELARNRPGAGAILDRMVGDAAEARRRRQEAARHRIGDYEFRESDYGQRLRPRRLGVGVARRPEHRDEHLR